MAHRIGDMPGRGFPERVAGRKAALERVGLQGLTIHRLRHSAGHMMREVEVPLEVIQRRLGHASIRTTADIYGSLPERVDRAVADQLDALFRASRSQRKFEPPHVSGDGRTRS